MISFDDFKKVEITVGKILSAEKVEGADKLLKLMVDFGVKENPSRALSEEGSVLSLGKGKNPSTSQTRVLPLEKGELEITTTRDIRQIISGIAPYFPEPEKLVGRKCMFATNIPSRIIKGLESNGMILAVSTDDSSKFSLLEPNDSIPEGARAK